MSENSSQSGAHVESGAPVRRSSRRRVSAIEEKPMARICGHNVRRSNYQAYGVVISLIRMSVYALLIGGLGNWPIAQTGSCLGVAVFYMVYLRFAVPYSRRDEMALEYWVALLDITIFGVLLGLCLTVDSEDFTTMDTYCIALIILQGLGMMAYLINRMLIIVHAFAEVVCPACSCSAPSPRKSSRSKRHRRSRSGGSTLSAGESLTYSASDMSIGISQQFYPEKGYYTNGNSELKDVDSVSGMSDPSTINGHGSTPISLAPPKQVQSMAPEGRSVSRSGRSGTFPAIIEEPNAIKVERDATGSMDQGGEVDHSQSKRGQNDVFDKFWRSL